MRRALAAALLAAVALACSGTDDEASPPSSAPATETVPATNGEQTSSTPLPSTVPPPTTLAEDAPPVGSSGCDGSTQRAVTSERRELRVRGAERWYLLTVPPEHDGRTPLPLVFDFHGFSEGAEVHTLMSAMPDYAAANGFIAVLPHGTAEPVRWDTTPDVSGNDDLTYVVRLLDRLGQDLCVDTSRVYATGLSNGAFISSTIACTLSDHFAAVAPVAGAGLDCDRLDRPVPVYAIHGTADPILYFNGGVNTANIPALNDGSAPTSTTLPEPDLDGEGYPANMVRWAELNGCDTQFRDRNLAKDVVRRVWDCPAGADVEFLIVLGGGHSWPGSDFSAQVESIIGPTTMNLDATDAMWTFFRRFTLPPR